MSRFVEPGGGKLLLLNVDRIVAAILGDDGGDGDEPTVEIYLTNDPSEKPMRLSWSDFEAVKEKALHPPRRHYYHDRHSHTHNTHNTCHNNIQQGEA